MPRILLNTTARREIATVLAIFIVAGGAGMVYISTWGQTADFLQTGFGPSVMLGCGRGFVNPKASAVPELAAFLRPELHRDGPPVIDSFSCDLLPEDMPAVPFTGIQKRTWHMFWIAGWVWRFLGVAWSSLTPLYGFLFGMSAVAAYGLFRLVMNPVIAVFCTTLFLMSPIQLHYLPRLRDFAKAPFMLLALYCLVLLLAYPRGWKRALWTGALAGASIGLATGFRAEAVMYLVLFVPAVWLFYSGWRWPSWGGRTVATAAFLLCFILAAWPVLMKFQNYGERTHPFLMGFGEIYDGRLGVANDTYQVSQRFLDAEALAQLNAHNLYLDGAAKPIIYETVGYEAVGDDYFIRNLLWRFPGDLATRTYASGLRILDELRGGAMPRGITHPVLESPYRMRARVMDTLFSRTRYVALALLLLLGALSPRLGFMALYVSFCLAGMASVQFATRHYFHLELIPLLAGGVVLHVVWTLLTLAFPRTRARLPEEVFTRAWFVGRVKVGLAFAVATTLLVLVPWHALRWHQDRELTVLFQDYEAAERDTIWPTVVADVDGKVRLGCGPASFSEGLPAVGPEGFFQINMLVFEFLPGPTPVDIRLAYKGDTGERDLSWTSVVPPASEEDGAIRYYIPVYNAVWPNSPDSASWDDVGVMWTRFEGLELADTDLPRLQGVSRFRYAAGYTPLIAAKLTPGWEQSSLYQRFVR
jgi:hypothetical protein